MLFTILAWTVLLGLILAVWVSIITFCLFLGAVLFYCFLRSIVWFFPQSQKFLSPLYESLFVWITNESKM